MTLSVVYTDDFCLCEVEAVFLSVWLMLCVVTLSCVVDAVFCTHILVKLMQAFSVVCAFCSRTRY